MKAKRIMFTFIGIAFEWKLHMVRWREQKQKSAGIFGRAYLFAATAAHQVPSM